MNSNSGKALTALELLVVLAVVAIVIAALLPSILSPRPHPPSCSNNLRQVGLSFLLWANDHSDKFPMQVSTNGGGTMELVQDPNAFAHFLVISNELSTPKLLLCPADSKRLKATSFAVLSSANLSYFVGVDASLTNKHMFLSGDRNITNGIAVKQGILELTTARPTGWTHELHVNAGNMGLADGSVQQLSTKQLREAIKLTGMETNRLAML